MCSGYAAFREITMTICFQNVTGVDENNAEDVAWCTTTPQYKKVAREAVRKMFREMKPQPSHDGLPRVPKSNFSQVAANKTEMKLLMKAGTFGRCSIRLAFIESR